MFDSIVLKWLVKKQKKPHKRIGSASDARNRIRRDDVYLQAIFFGKNSNFDACD